jgi:hypothetical protein
MACCTSRNGTCLTVGSDLEPTEVPDRFRFRLRASRRLDAPTADKRAFREFRDYQRIEGYASYQVESRSDGDPMTDYQYVVRFSRT